MVKTIQKCRICGNPHLEVILDFGDQWIQGFFNYPNKPEPPKRKITTKIVRCMPEKFENGCGAIQNLVSVDPNILYSNYGYSSSISDTMKKHLQSITIAVSDFNPKIRSVLDIGGNSGELIQNHKKAKVKVVVDPSDVSKNYSKYWRDIELVNKCYPCGELFGRKFDAIYSIACLYDISDLHDFLKSIKINLNYNGIYTFEVAYLPAVLKNCAYDGLVLEHIHLFSFSILDRVFKECGLKIFSAIETDTNGGSLLGFATHQEYAGYDKYSHWLNIFRLKEFDLELDTNKPYKVFSENIEKSSKELVKTLKRLKKNGERIYILGASTKLNVILQKNSIGTNYIDGASERDFNKVGGSILNGIPIVSEGEARKKATVYLVGPYHFKTEILGREAEAIKNGVKFLFPLPKVELI